MSLFNYPQNKRPLIVTDTETTGLNPLVHDLIEIGAIYVNQETMEEEDRFEAKIKIQHPEMADEKALQVNGYTREMWASAKELPTVVRDFNEWAAEGIMVAQNVAFDYTFCMEAFRRCKVLSKLDYHSIDLPSIVWFLYPDRKHTGLRSVAIDLGIPPEPKIHRAVNGAETCYRILRKLVLDKRNENPVVVSRSRQIPCGLDTD